MNQTFDLKDGWALRSRPDDHTTASTGALWPAVHRFIDAHRQEGHRFAALDPTGAACSLDLGALAPERFGLQPADPLTTDGSSWEGAADVQTLDRQLKAAYCGALALDASAVRDETRRAWLHARMETPATAVPPTTAQRLLERLVQAEAWEHFMAEHYGHGKRFSLEGCEALVPLLDALFEAAAGRGIRYCFMGMPHRGRVNVLANVLGATPATLLGYFESDPAHPELIHDLVYHLGADHEVATAHGAIEVTLAPNPSHLQSVYPVVMGMAHAFQSGQPHEDRRQAALPLALHGDAAFAGQGVVMETLALTQKPGYTVGGTVHVIINNQVGFTEPNPMDPQAARYCTDITRMVDAPVLRVNADVPQALLRAAAIAVDYRMAFGADVVIDLIGYRRLGHSEHDVPMLTNPRHQPRCDRKSSVVALYAAELAATGVVPDAPAFAEQCRAAARARFAEPGRPTAEAPAPQAQAGVEALPLSRTGLQAAVAAMTRLPQGFESHAMVRELIARWQSAMHDADGRTDWCLAENLAYASLLAAGIDVRVSGLDVQRGTFMHRHAVWHDQAGRHDPFVPLRQLPNAARFEAVNSVLSEEAVLGFEYGHSVQARKALTVWEAQFGDFVNGAQVFIDHYLSAGEEKWGQASALTLLLPHGYEGVGPEHSNAWLARFLALCGADNLRVAYPSTAAQLFHLLRRQATAAERKPLVVMTPKSVLAKEAGSHCSIDQLVAGTFEPVLQEAELAAYAGATRVVLCSGKLYYALERARREQGRTDVALLRLEQLYPFPAAELARVLAAFPALRTLVWAQEETLNQGAWHFVRDDLAAALPAGAALACAARPVTASGATSSHQLHLHQERELVQRALGVPEDAGH
ncbi:2-oxoglutarate dehydrogenase E1 component [Azohydromonas caseinilytica]|uniref:oxoglutarate dehydrogenase (succinyl-transferring) n=1 Tax=Azohydromonas caseinilytica TaxID=2728836 RepID=A0A848FKN3_9BURK|nr:2-oxoglutarate dehydrogenase E1 component [Azohydromonas caseinilytica]NML18803.1 2-oxoglutarate dehydrogenase E1 component [Azohydromonas caseinilytica]